MFRAASSAAVAFLTALLLPSPAVAAEPVAASWVGPNHVEVDLLRPGPGGSRIFVQATLPDGEPGLFLVDTGAAISALSGETAERLGLEVDEGWGFVEGLGGRAPLDRAVLPSLRLGEAVVPDVSFAVAVRGVPEYAGAMPLDGILGNNVWSRFLLEIDYPADTMVLHRPGTVRMPRRADPMFFDGSHVFAPVTITTDAEPPHTDRVVIQVDTGAGGLMLAGASGRRFEQDYTEGIEPILGIGGNEDIPPHTLLKRTRRVPIASVEIGGRTVETVDEARWVNFEGQRAIGPDGLKGLAGHDLLAGHVVFFDYQGGRILLKPSRRKARQVDGHRVLLDQDVARYGDDPSRYLHRARLHAWLGEEEEAVRLLEVLLDHPTEDDEEMAEARVLLAIALRLDGDLDGAWEALAPLGPGELVDQGQIVGAVNGLLLEDRNAEALALAEEALAVRAEEPVAHVAFSDALFAAGRLAEAEEALQAAARLAENPDAQLLRRARISLARGDTWGAMAQIRRLVSLYPYEGLFLWFYAELVHEGVDPDTFRHDLSSAMARLHPGDRPLDFLVAAWRTLGEEERAAQLMHQGIDRDCSLAVTVPSSENCHAWYWALAGEKPAEALEAIDRALAATGERSDFLDTKAMVHLSRGELAEAHRAAIAAARLAPDDIYMLWQAERLEVLARRADRVESAAAEPTP